jgi:hypothetical protein
MKVVFVGEPGPKELARVYGILDRMEDAPDEKTTASSDTDVRLSTGG